MKNCFQKVILTVICIACAACQNVPKSKPIAEMTEDEKKAAYMYGPISTPPKEHPHLKKALIVTSAVLISIPLIILIGSVTEAAREGKQVQIGK